MELEKIFDLSDLPECTDSLSAGIHDHTDRDHCGSDDTISVTFYTGRFKIVIPFMKRPFLHRQEIVFYISGKNSYRYQNPEQY